MTQASPMTCYDLAPESGARWPLNGAQLLVLPAAWRERAAERAASPGGRQAGGTRPRYATGCIVARGANA
ncbi:hypothetical protein LNQ52_00110 [Klebsiella pneumoniae subsp. pneumoniae]|nr:hypothetical protein [Klebsiella pneumoniae subsp. pneumoniae]